MGGHKVQQTCNFLYQTGGSEAACVPTRVVNVNYKTCLSPDLEFADEGIRGREDLSLCLKTG